MNSFRANSKCTMFSDFIFHWLEYEGDKNLTEKEKNSTSTKIVLTMERSKGHFVFSGIKIGPFVTSSVHFQTMGYNFLPGKQVDYWKDSHILLACVYINGTHRWIHSSVKNFTCLLVTWKLRV